MLKNIFITGCPNCESDDIEVQGTPDYNQQVYVFCNDCQAAIKATQMLVYSKELEILNAKQIYEIEIDTVDLTIRKISDNEMEDFKKFAEKRIANFLLESGFLDDLVSSFKARDKL